MYMCRAHLSPRAFVTHSITQQHRTHTLHSALQHSRAYTALSTQHTEQNSTQHNTHIRQQTTDNRLYATLSTQHTTHSTTKYTTAQHGTNNAQYSAYITRHNIMFEILVILYQSLHTSWYIFNRREKELALFGFNAFGECMLLASACIEPFKWRTILIVKNATSNLQLLCVMNAIMCSANSALKQFIAFLASYNTKCNLTTKR